MSSSRTPLIIALALGAALLGVLTLTGRPGGVGGSSAARPGDPDPGYTGTETAGGQPTDALGPTSFERAPIVLEVRAGALGGNPIRVSLAGEKSIHVDRTSDIPLDTESTVDRDEPRVTYFSGGSIPPGKRFIVTDIDYVGRGNGRADGEFIISLLGKRVVDLTDLARPIEGSWSGEVSVGAGQEHRVVLQVSNVATARVVLRGRLESDE